MVSCADTSARTRLPSSSAALAASSAADRRFTAVAVWSTASPASPNLSTKKPTASPMPHIMAPIPVLIKATFIALKHPTPTALSTVKLLLNTSLATADALVVVMLVTSALVLSHTRRHHAAYCFAAPATLIASVEMPPMAVDAIAAKVTKGWNDCTTAPARSLMSPSVFSNCFCLPTSVCANLAFICPTFCVMISAINAARSSSVPIFRASFCASLIVMPTRVSADTCPCIALPIMLAMV